MTGSENSKTPVDVLLYVPNLIGYARLALLFLGFMFMEYHPFTFVLLYTISIALDFFDGWAARAFNQTSAFGAWLDVIVDNLSRACLWSYVFNWGWMIICIEWITFVCNHQGGSKWREMNTKSIPHLEINPPQFVLRIMANGFKTPLGTWVILGLHVLPLWIYAMQTGLLDLYIPYYVSLLICLILAGGRIQCMACELWCIQKHIRELLFEDTSGEVNSNTKKD